MKLTLLFLAFTLASSTALATEIDIFAEPVTIDIFAEPVATFTITANTEMYASMEEMQCVNGVCSVLGPMVVASEPMGSHHEMDSHTMHEPMMSSATFFDRDGGGFFARVWERRRARVRTRQLFSGRIFSGFFFNRMQGNRRSFNMSM